MHESVTRFFEALTGSAILPYQQRYAENPFVSTLIGVPTGLGKTFTVVIPWLHAVLTEKPGAPTRLVIVLPRQNLTEQIRRVARELVERAGLAASVRVLQLMGGSDDNDLTLLPNQHAIVVCTQDLYLSRALNRGYARRPPRWPIDFALFNNDCLVVFDEVQLMSDGVATSSQLAAFRDKYGVFGAVPCVWMSATLNSEWLRTIDFRDGPGKLSLIGLNDSDKQFEIVRKRLYAVKSLSRAPESCRDPGKCAEFVLEKHRPGQRTLVIANTVLRAREIFANLQHRHEAVLLHSRFRPVERAAKVSQLDKIPPEGQIVVSTQVLEAGIDITAHRLITDIAPWSSLVQRFGRVNRYGDEVTSSIWWVDEPLSSRSKPGDRDSLYAPYSLQEIDISLARLHSLNSAAPADLHAEDGPAPWNFVLRKSDLLDLFDTSPDIAGNDIDVSRFIRAGEEKDAYVAWRTWDEDAGTSDLSEAADEELCPVSIGDLRDYLRKQTLYSWSFATGRWEIINVKERDRLFPGMILLANARTGGYTEELGWDPASKRPVPVVSTQRDRPESDSSNISSETSRQSLFDHTTRVYEEMTRLIAALPHLEIAEHSSDLLLAAIKHDWGKAHDVMQRTLHASAEWTELLAKQDKDKAARGHERKHFRHELASALAMVQTGDSDLAAYLVAAHHGRVRMAIRSMPGESQTGNGPRMRGIEEGDRLPAFRILAGSEMPEVSLSLRIARLGSADSEAPSWTARAIALRDCLGPFRLAFLETLLRAADEYASKYPDLESQCQS